MASFDFSRVLFYGRTFREYCDMFLLEPEKLIGKRILDCPAGFGSFVSEAGPHGIAVTAVDPLLATPPGRLQELAREHTDELLKESFAKPDLLIAQNQGTQARIKEFRESTFHAFFRDFCGNPEGRYLAGGLPHLPFIDGAFDLTLSGHFLFCYGNHLSPEFHLAAVRELLRVTKEEVKIYPVSGLDTRRSPHLEMVLKELDGTEFHCEIKKVPYEMVRNWNEMLLIKIS